MVCCDVGGTSFDVGIIRDGAIPITREPTLLSFRANIPMIQTESIGAGMGSELGIHPLTGKLTVGRAAPGLMSAAACAGPTRPSPTAIVLLGYLDPGNFLGGDVPLDFGAARDALEPMAKQLQGRPAGFLREGAPAGHRRMREFLNNMLRGRGYTTRECTMLMYGGGGPLGLADVVEGQDFDDVITFPFAAVFSAFGVLCAPRRYRYHQSTDRRLPARRRRGQAGSHGRSGRGDQ